MKSPDYIVTRRDLYQLQCSGLALVASHMKSVGYSEEVTIESAKGCTMAYRYGGPYDLVFVAGSRSLFDRFMRSTRSS